MLVGGQNSSSIRGIDVLYLYNAACNVLYPNVVKLESGSFQQYGEMLKKINCDIYQCSMNSNLNLSLENLHRSLFSTSDVNQIQSVRTVCHNRKEIIIREVFRDWDGKYRHQNFIQWNDQFQQEIFPVNEKTVFRNLKTECLYIWLKAKDIALSVSTVYLIFQFVKIFYIVHLFRICY